MFKFFFSFSIGEAGFKMLNLQDKNENENINSTAVVYLLTSVIDFHTSVTPSIMWNNAHTHTLDAGNTSRGGGLLSSLLGLVGLKHSNSLIHLKTEHLMNHCIWSITAELIQAAIKSAWSDNPFSPALWRRC